MFNPPYQPEFKETRPLYNNGVLIGYYGYQTNYNQFSKPFIWLLGINLACFIFFYLVLRRKVKQSIRVEFESFELFLKSLKRLARNINNLRDHGRQDLLQIPKNKEQNEIKKVIDLLADEIEKSHKKIQTITEQAEKDEAKKRLGEVAAQVAHDIRSPLAALNTSLKLLSKVPEEQRVLMRNAANRINDIANNLLQQYKGLPAEVEGSCKIGLLAPVVESIISEKRLALETQPVQIEVHISQDGFAAFAEFDSMEMKRILSNLINNAVEAFAVECQGKIEVYLDAKQDHIDLAVIDNGQGIPAASLLRILEEGLSLKAQGHGLGLSHAKKTIEAWGGILTLTSTEGKGTQVLLRIPRKKAPSWFVSGIQVSEGRAIGILDDDQSVHDAWDQRLLVVSKKLQIHHFKYSKDFIQWIQAQTHAVQIFSDHELEGDPLTGLEVLEKLQFSPNAILVTSHYEKADIIARCQKQGIRLLPKNLLAHVLIELTVPGEIKHYDAVLLDDHQELCSLWEMSAFMHNKSFLAFSSIADLEAALPEIDSKTAIYIDSELGSEVKGETYAQTLFERGYTELYLATGYDISHFGPLPWIKAIMSKEPPF